MADTHEQERTDLSQSLMQQGRVSEVEEALKKLEKRQQEEVDSKQAELDTELNTAEVKLVQMVNEEANSTVVAAHRKLLEEVQYLQLKVHYALYLSMRVYAHDYVCIL